MRAIVYVWDSRYPTESILPNTWAPKEENMIVLQSGTAEVSQWVSEVRNVYRDFKAAFPGEEPESVKAFAIACDTDQTAEQVTTYFDDIAIRSK